MALMRCPECGKEISSTCPNCFHCGCSLRKPSPKRILPIAFRASASGWLIFFCVLSFVLGFFFGGAGITMMVYYAIRPSFLVFLITGILFLALAFCLFLTPIINFVRIGQNSDLQEPCIAYDESSGNLLFAALNGKEILISPSQYLDLSCGIFTDFFLIVHYLDSKQRKRKARLGFTSNRWEAQRALSSLKGEWNRR